MGTTSDVLFTKTQQRVLAILFGQPARTFYANEIIGLAAIGSGAVQRELSRLESAGLLTSRRVGNQKHYQANQDAPIFPELCSIVRKTFGVTDVIRAALTAFVPQLQLAFVYGSIAKGTEHAGSDIDLLLIGELPSQAQLLDALSAAQAQLGRTINPTAYTANEFAQRQRDGRTFLKRILDQPKLFIHGSEHDLPSLNGAGEPGADWQTEGGATG